ncbi:Inositol 2-dehydrogenase/D-chiro-inositol 3-dehydrogenase [subsurface metagenome]
MAYLQQLAAFLCGLEHFPGAFEGVGHLFFTIDVQPGLKAYKHVNNTYVDYREMLEKEKDLDAVIIATPDFWHCEQTVACLEAGLHVYCEKEMSNTLEGAKKMLEAAKKSGKLLQIGHQRRSNPRYIHCYEKLINGSKLLGRITTINGQWNRSKAACEDLGWPKNRDIEQATLKKYGFDSMKQFKNWRWYKGLGGGPIVDLGSHQIDIYSWFLGTNPKSVMASGGIDYWKEHDWYDNVMAIYEYETKQGTVRAFYQTITTNSSQGYFETFMGDEGSLVISEAAGRGTIYREAWVPAQNWEKWVKMGYIKEPPEEEEKEEAPAGEGVLDVRETPKPPSYDLPVTMDNKLYHQPHLENFFDAVRGKAKLNCPAEIGYETAVTVLKVNEAVAAGRKLEFKPGEFEV